MTTLSELRMEIDKIDANIIKQLAKRQRIAEKVGRYKRRHGTKIVDAKRETQMSRARYALSLHYQLNIPYVERIFKIIITYSRRLQR